MENYKKIERHSPIKHFMNRGEKSCFFSYAQAEMNTFHLSPTLNTQSTFKELLHG